MKKLLLSLLIPVIFVALTVAAYVMPLKVREHTGNTTAWTPAPVKAGEPAAHSPEDLKVTFNESRVAAQPKDAQAYRLLAHALTTRAEATANPADYDRAWSELERADTLEPNSLRTYLFRARLLKSRHRFSQARLVAEQGLQRDPDNVALIGLAGDTCLAVGELDEAESHYNKLVNIAPKSPETWAKISYLAEMRGQLDEAAALMQKALKAGYEKDVNFATRASLHTMLGEIEAKRGNLDSASTQYKLALENVPDYRLALQFTADLDLRRGNLESAETSYRKLLADRFDPKIQLSLADLLEQRGGITEAAQMRAESSRFYERVIAGGNERYLRELATLDLAAKRYTRAAELAARDVGLRPTKESRMLYERILKEAETADSPR